ncbi:MAG: tetratricopeptide repeat protein [Desulfomonilaceae bacterium]
MDAVTYSNKKVAEFINANMIPVRVPHNQKPLTEEFKVKWTPTVITLDQDGKEQQRTIGFLPPSELIPSLMLGIGKTRLERGEFAQAIPELKEVSAKYPTSDSAPEAVFYLGVAQFKSTHDLKYLRQAYDKLAAQYPKSQWAMKASPYSSIK